MVALLGVNGVLGGTAAATTVVQCRMELAHLLQTGAAANAYPSSRPEANGLALLDSASLALAEGRNADAVQRLTDFLAQGHFSSGVQDVINCINAIGTPYNPPVSGSVAGGA